MLFAHDTRMSLLAAAALVNTLSDVSDSGTDELADLDSLEAYVVEHQYSGSRTHDEGELAAVRSIRSRLRRLWDVDGDQAVEQVNALLREYQALPQLVRHEGWGWHVHGIDAQSPLADRISVEVALAIVDLIRGEELSRLKHCAGEDCNAVLVDLSRNRSKRYCDVGNCGNRANVAAYRARKSEG